MDKHKQLSKSNSQRPIVKDQQSKTNSQKAIVREQQSKSNSQRAIVREQQSESNSQRAVVKEQQKGKDSDSLYCNLASIKTDHMSTTYNKDTAIYIVLTTQNTYSTQKKRVQK